jgi:acyl-coenzyme A thioesterase PaaI-like protein
LQNAEPSQVVGTLAWAPDRCTAGGILHGGALMAVADSGRRQRSPTAVADSGRRQPGGVCAYLNLPEGAATSTIESKPNFFRGVCGGRRARRRRPLHVGRSTIVVHTELRDDEDRLVAFVIQTQAVLGPAGPRMPALERRRGSR